MEWDLKFDFGFGFEFGIELKRGKGFRFCGETQESGGVLLEFELDFERALLF